LRHKSGLGEDALNCYFVPKQLTSAPTKPLSAAAAKLRLLKTLHCTLRFEKKASQLGARFIAGVDEVGRGSLFGPVVAAAVILDPAHCGRFIGRDPGTQQVGDGNGGEDENNRHHDQKLN